MQHRWVNQPIKTGETRPLLAFVLQCASWVFLLRARVSNRRFRLEPEVLGHLSPAVTIHSDNDSLSSPVTLIHAYKAGHPGYAHRIEPLRKQRMRGLKARRVLPSAYYSGYSGEKNSLSSPANVKLDTHNGPHRGGQNCCSDRSQSD